MAEIAAAFLGSAIEFAKWVAAPITRQFNYLCCFSSNITTLKQEGENLEVTTVDLQGKVDRERDNVQVIAREVETWLINSQDIKDEIDGILNEVPNVESGCLKLRARFSLGKRAKKTTDRLKELRGQCKFEAIAHPGPPAAMQAIPIERTYEFESRKQIEEDIMTTLGGGDVNTMGICGMGGLGKTTMAKRIMNRALKEHVFEEVVMAVVSQPVDKLRIQVEIGGSLGLLGLKDETSQARLQKLHARLTSTKQILLVLDDVWERLVLEDLGIPRGCKGCTILLTSRNRDVLSAMNVEKVFGMEVLSEEEAWFLFRESAGTCVDDTKLNSIAKQVAQECTGLPIALTIVGAALKDEMNESIWNDALRQLKQPEPDIQDYIAKVYNPLKLSYDALGSKHAKSLFLLCCLYPEDDDIPLEDLTYFCLGLGIFEGGIRNVEEARNRMCALTKKLKSRSLLLDSEDGDDYVRMHDVVRDVCIFIARQEGCIGDNNCTWISSFQRTELPTGLGFPNLRLLFLFRNSAEEEFKLDSSFLEGIKDLYVLSIENNSLTSLPRTTQSLRNLNTLVLESCWKLKTISFVGELVNLEVLICRDCYSIEELPPEIKGLSRLKLLQLTNCFSLQRIGRGIISSLVGLEELKMKGSFKKWEAEDREERENAGVRELEALINLRCLEIEIQDPSLCAESMHLSSKIDRFHIRISTDFDRLKEFDSYLSKTKMSLCWKEETCVGHWIQMQLLRDVECLYLTGNGANNLNLAKIQNIRFLELGKCETMKNIVTTSMDDGGGATVFSSIEYLKIFELPKLEEIWDGRISSNSFLNLKELSLSMLPSLKQFWKSSSIRQNNLGKDCLPQLEVLKIEECEMMEQVFLWNGEDENENNSSESRNHITKMFPKLKEVRLYSLPNLASFYQGIEGIEFPQLLTMSIFRCGKVKSMVSNGMGSNENNSGGCSNADMDDDSSHLFCQPQKVSFGCLKELDTDRNPFGGHKIPVSLFNGLEKLTISGYQGSMNLFASSIAGNLINLKELKIRYCYEMVQVINDDEEEKSGGERTLLFPKLQMLQLFNLPKLVSFCEWKCDVELPSLREVKIGTCPNMKNFTLGPLNTPKLERVRINSQDFGVAKDLNDALQQHLAREKKKQEEEEEKKKGGEEDQETKGEIEEEQD